MGSTHNAAARTLLVTARRTQGDGGFTVNGKPLARYFPRLADRRLTLEPLVVTQTCGAFDVDVAVSGACRGAARGATVDFDPAPRAAAAAVQRRERLRLCRA